MDKQKSKPQLPTVPVLGPEYAETLRKYASRLGNKVNDWLMKKLANPLELIGNDKPFRSKGPYAGLSHAHLGDDISIVYNIKGSNPRKLRLYGFYTHEDLGTSPTPKKKIQQSVGKRLTSQVFEQKRA